MSTLHFENLSCIRFSFYLFVLCHYVCVCVCVVCVCVCVCVCVWCVCGCVVAYEHMK